jgi:hypothetical protein
MEREGSLPCSQEPSTGLYPEPNHSSPQILKSYIALTGWTLEWRSNMFRVRYELGFYIPEGGILHSHRHENLKSYTALTGWALYRRRNVFHMRHELGFYISEDGILHSHRRENLKFYIALTGWAL